MDKAARRPTAYIVDTENVHSRFRLALAGAQAADLVVWAYTDAFAVMSLDDLSFLSSCPAAVRAIRCYNGVHDALDGQIASMLGALAAAHGDGWRYRIVSNDRGYEPSVRLWRAAGLDVGRIGVPADAPLSDVVAHGEGFDLSDGRRRDTFSVLAPPASLAVEAKEPGSVAPRHLAREGGAR